MVDESTLADQICGCATTAQHKRDIALLQEFRTQAEANTIAEVVAWLRESAAWHDKHDDGLSGFDGISQGQREAADALETGEWRNG